MPSDFIYECSDCCAQYPAGEIQYLCPKCGESNSQQMPPRGVLKVIYDYKNIGKHKNNDWFSPEGYSCLLPLKSISSLPDLRVGMTPLYIKKHNQSELLLKDDSQNPTYSFKDRASTLVSAFAAENNIKTLVAASTGNAGSSLAGICAANSQKAIILVPSAAPKAKLAQIIMYGATIVPIDGTYDDAFDMSIALTQKYGWYNRNTAFNPMTIEGKKTVSFEIWQQLGHNIPTRIFVPVGDGVIISGVYKGFEDLLLAGLIDRIPEIIAVQAEGSANLHRNMQHDGFELSAAKTVADSISVDIPRNFYMAKGFIKKYKGETLTVTDKEIMQASSTLCSSHGLFAEPAAATAYAGYSKFIEQGRIMKGDKNLVLLTGSGLKDIKSVESLLNMPDPIKKDINIISAFINDRN